MVSSVAGVTRSPIWAVAIAATPSIERRHLGEADIQFGGLDFSLRRLQRRLRRQCGLLIVVELALRDGALLGQRLVTRQVALCLSQLRLRFGPVGPRLRERGRKRSRIDFEQHLPLPDRRTFLVIPANQVARYLRPDLRVDVSVERGDPFFGQRHVFWLHVDDRDRRAAAAPERRSWIRSTRARGRRRREHRCMTVFEAWDYPETKEREGERARTAKKCSRAESKMRSRSQGDSRLTARCS